MDRLNYHHLRYFREVALDGNLTRTADRMNLSQSALSSQIRNLEDRLGHALFDRVGRRLVLTEVGRIALDHAERIFGTGEELLATLNRTGRARAPIRVGALSTLSRNFQLRFLQPVLGSEDVDLVLKSGNINGLLAALKSLALDVVLTTEPPRESEFIARKLAEQPVALHGIPTLLNHEDLPSLLNSVPIIAPTDSAVRAGFDSLVAGLSVSPRIRADVDDMAMVRLLAREGAGVALAPSVVFKDEIDAGRIAVSTFDLGLTESFFAVTVHRNFPNPLLEDLIRKIS